MIRLIEKRSLPGLLSFCEESPYGVRIAAFLEAYGTGYPFAQFWMQTDASGRSTAALSRVDGNVTVCAVMRADLEEIWEFLYAVGFESVLCSEWVVRKGSLLPGCRLQRCLPMRLYSSLVPQNHKAVSLCKEPPLPKIYEILTAAGETLPSLAAWLPDVSHRVRHGTARVWAVQDRDEWIACAMAVALTRREALLGGVAVLPEKRTSGIGSYLTASLCRALSEEGKMVFLFHEDGLHEAFYRRIGFEPYGEPALIITQKGV